MVGVVERFDSEWVTDEGEAFFSGVPDGKGEHAVEPGEAGGSVLRPRLKKDLCVGLGPEEGSAGLEVAAQLDVVVDFAVKNEVPATVGGGHGLGTTREVKDTKAAVTQADGGVGVRTFRVGPAMGQGIGHFGQGGRRVFRGVSMGGESCDAAHRSTDSTEEVVHSRPELG